MATLALERRGSVLAVRVCNPPTDLLDAGVLADLAALVSKLRRDDEVRAVVLTGPRAGVFVPHYLIDDILDGSERLGITTPYPLALAGVTAAAVVARVPALRRVLSATPASGLVDLALTHRTLTALGRLPQVVIAAIDGDAQGGGCELALACDIRVMSDGPYRIGLPELSAGIPPGAGGTQRLMAAVGAARARAMVLGARVLAPQEALDAGLVDAVSSDPMETALGIAERVAGWNPGAVRAVKRVMRPRGMLTALIREAAGFASVASGAAAREQLRDFVERSDNAHGVSPWRTPVSRPDAAPATLRTPAPPGP